MQAEELLKNHGLRKTAGRMAVLEAFAQRGKALSHSELQHCLGQQVDRVTLYRILESFEQRGILHKVPDDEVSVKYAMCGHHHEVDHAHADNHAHFKCNACGDTICLEEAEIPAITAPNGFRIESRFLLLNGRCGNCG